MPVQKRETSSQDSTKSTIKQLVCRLVDSPIVPLVLPLARSNLFIINTVEIDATVTLHTEITLDQSSLPVMELCAKEI
jgi:hypothetical protein